MSQLGYIGCTMLGRLTRDPGHRAKDGADPVNVGCAVNHTRERVSFFELLLWGEHAKTFRAHAKKGDQVLFVTEPYVDSWKGQNGEARKEVRFKVLRWQFTGAGERPREEQPADAPPDNPAPADSGLDATDLLSRI